MATKAPKKYNRNARETRNFAFLVAPAVFVFLLVIAIPFFLGVYYSFTDWGGVTQTDTNFVGFKNYIQSLTDTRFQYSLMITFLFAIINVIVINVVSFSLALLFSSAIKGRNLYRAGFFLPNLIGGLVLGYIW